MSPGLDRRPIDGTAYRVGRRCRREFLSLVFNFEISNPEISNSQIRTPRMCATDESSELLEQARTHCEHLEEIQTQPVERVHAPWVVAAGGLWFEFSYALERSSGVFDAVLFRAVARAREAEIVELGFALYVCERAGIPLDRVYLLQLNPSYRRTGEIDLEALFRLIELTSAARRSQDRARQEVPRLLAEVDAHAERLAKLNTTETHSARETAFETAMDAVARCERLGLCPVCDGPRHLLAIDDLRTLGGKRSHLKDRYREGYRWISQLSEDARLDPVQAVQRRAVTTGTPVVDHEELGRFLDRLRFPALFLDFEAVNSALPLYQDSAPFEHVPFLFSAHLLAAPEDEAEAEHFDYIMAPGRDERSSLAEAVAGVVARANSIVVFDATFERKVLGYLADRVSRSAEELRAAQQRLFDLLLPFRSLWYYHPEQRGRYSMKTVVPAVCGLNWADLTVSDGRRAGEAYRSLCLAPDADDRDAVLHELRRYCRRDTAAMIALYRALTNALTES